MANFTQEGSNYLLTQMCEGGTIAADQTWLGLATAAPTNSTTLATVTEHSTGGGYGRKQVTSANWSVSAGGVASMASTVTWGTGITLTAATHWFLCTVASGTAGKLICYGALSATRSLTTADTLTEQVTDIHLA
jgi:hypothetical protein